MASIPPKTLEARSRFKSFGQFVIKALYRHASAKKETSKVATDEAQTDSTLTIEQGQVGEQAKATGQEIVLHDPYEVMKPWGMVMPLDYSRFHYNDLEFEDLEQDAKSIIIREMNDWCQEKFSYYRVSLLSPVNEHTFARYTIRRPSGDSLVCSLSLTFTSSDTLRVTFDPPDNARRADYESISDRAREIVFLLYRCYGKQEPKQHTNDTEDLSVSDSEEAEQAYMQQVSDPSSSEAARLPSGYGIRPETVQRMAKLRELRKNSIRGGKVTLQWTAACEQVPISPNTVKKLDPKLRARWDDATYT